MHYRSVLRFARGLWYHLVCGRETQPPRDNSKGKESIRSIGCVQTDRWPERSEAGELTESQAIQRAQQGDAEAFELLYRQHSRRVYALCLRMVGRTPEAED